MKQGHTPNYTNIVFGFIFHYTSLYVYVIRTTCVSLHILCIKNGTGV